jgi:zinc/manganese transport system permease protein
MSEMLELMAAPFAACVVLVGIHAYLGMHVIQRKIIFVDLALAQIAALGATFGFLLGLGPHERGAYFFSLGFAIVGAAIFAMTRVRHERISQEAIIGIVYAVALAGAILVADRAPEGSEHIKETLVGMLLWVRWPTVIKTAIIYALVGLLHIALRRRFLQISFHPQQAYAQGRYVRLWDFIFYVTFAFVITSSVAIAGVLVVFSFLVIPAVIATLFTTSIGSRLALSWAVGIGASLVGMVASYRFDLPSGPAVVVSLGSALLLAGLLYSILAAPKRRYALLKVLAGVVLVGGILAALGVFVTSGTFMHIAHDHEWEREHEPKTVTLSELRRELQSICADDLDCLVEQLGRHEDWPLRLAPHLHSGGPHEHRWWMDVLQAMDDPRARDLLAAGACEEPDLLIRLEFARRLADEGDARGPACAAELLDDSIPPLIRDEAYQLLLDASRREFGYEPLASAQDNEAALSRIQDWLATQQ